MGEISTIGLDLAKHVFQVHGVDEEGSVVVRKQLRRSAVLKFFAQLGPCTVGLEACASAHYWAREIAALGHRVKLMPPAYVKPYVKRGKNDAADAEAICEAVMRPTMRFVPVKSAEQQAQAMIYKVRELLVRQRTQLINALRSHLAEMGIVAAQGTSKLEQLIAVVRDPDDRRLPAAARGALQELVRQIEALEARLDPLDREIAAQVRASAAGRRLAGVPGIGPIVAGALLAMVPDPGGFRSARHFAAWLGFAPRQNSSGGKQRLGSISKQGNRYLRSLLILGARNVLCRNASPSAWLTALRARRPFRVAAVALAHKTARIVWALLVKGGTYRAATPAVAAS
ncbi:MAG TPA: IS110 family transposase [Burkholderiaceae bacterium]|nr:IS110 family transposase [Burkholderiaceae bacterium]